MRTVIATLGLLGLVATASAEPMREVKGLRANEGCTQQAVAATEKLRICPIGARTRIWCPNGKVFDRDSADIGVAVLRSICEMNQLPPA
jgi:hypothetical protein